MSGPASAVFALLSALTAASERKIFASLAFVGLGVIIWRQALVILDFKEKLRSKLNLSCGPEVLGCKVPSTLSLQNQKMEVVGYVKGNFLRVRVEADGPEAIFGCSGSITRIEFGNVTMMGHETLQLTFAPGNRFPEAIAKTIRDKEPQYLDILAVLSDNRILICQPNFFVPNAVNTNFIFQENGDYFITIVIAGTGVPSTRAVLKFAWTGSWHTAELSLLRVDA